MPRNKGGGGHRQWKEKPTSVASPSVNDASDVATENVTDRLRELSVADCGHSLLPVCASNDAPQQHSRLPGQKVIWKPKCGTVSGKNTESGNGLTNQQESETPKREDVANASEELNAPLSNLFRGNLLENFTVDSSTYAKAQIRATFYPKFENEKSDQEIRTRMIEMVSNGLATLEASLKHSGSLFMYAGNEGGAYAKNSFGNIYTAVGVFVLGREFKEAWGAQASKKQAEFNSFLERNRMCISMELVTAVLGDHGQRPREDYVVVTAVTEMGNGKPRFYSTPEIIAFCRKWRLPTNHVWLFSTRKSVTSFFAAFDALCEEGTATPVCKALDEVADISIPGSKDHMKVQGEILEGLVARIVSRESSKHMEDVLRDYPLPPLEGAGLNLGPNLREICAENRSDEKQQIKALLESIGTSFCPAALDWFGKEPSDTHSRNADRSALIKFLQAHPADFSTTKLQEMIRLMKERRFPAAFKCYYNLHKLDAITKNNLYYKLVIHVRSDSVFRRYQKEMRHNPRLWPLYRGFFVDINLYKADEERVAEITSNNGVAVEYSNGSNGTAAANALADEDANLMIKLKFLTYKLRTFLIRNGLPVLFKEGPAAYKAYYMRQMKNWGTSSAKQREMSKLLDEWAVHIRRKCGYKQLGSSTYLSEAEPFLEQYAKRSAANQALVGSAGNFVRSEDFLAIIGGQDEEGDLEREHEPPSPAPTIKDTLQKDEGLIIFFPGIPGCAKSALCKELLNNPGGFGDDRPVQTLMGDLVKGKYWQKIAELCRKKPYSIMLADKNAPNEEVWRQIENMCRSTKSSAVPVIPESEGSDSNPYSLDALAIFMFRVLQRINHPGNLDKASPNAGYVLLMFYHLYDGKGRKEFELELIERFGSLVKMPLLRPDRYGWAVQASKPEGMRVRALGVLDYRTINGSSTFRGPLPHPVKSVLDNGMKLYRLHTKDHRRLDSTKGLYAKQWFVWEKQLRDTLSNHAEYLNSIQVPFEVAVSKVVEQLKSIAKGDYTAPSTERRKLGSIIYAAITLPTQQVLSALNSISEKNEEVEAFFKEKRLAERAHITLAHKRSHGVAAVANYGEFLHQRVPVELTALLFSDKTAAFEARPGCVEGQKVETKNEWGHVTVWTGEGVAPREANHLPKLHAQGEATRLEIDPPIVIYGEVEFF